MSLHLRFTVLHDETNEQYVVKVVGTEKDGDDIIYVREGFVGIGETQEEATRNAAKLLRKLADTMESG